MRGLSPLVAAASSHRRLRQLLLGRFPDDADGFLARELAPAALQSASLVRVELSTVANRSRAAEALAQLNAGLSARHAGDARLEQLARELERRRHALRVQARASVRRAAGAFVSGQLQLGPRQAHSSPPE